jgi:hypothetical protein
MEEDFYLGHADKLVFAMKELKADLAPDNLYTRANPLIVSKLDIKVSGYCLHNNRALTTITSRALLRWICRKNLEQDKRKTVKLLRK